MNPVNTLSFCLLLPTSCESVSRSDFNKVNDYKSLGAGIPLVGFRVSNLFSFFRIFFLV